MCFVSGPVFCELFLIQYIMFQGHTENVLCKLFHTSFSESLTLTDLSFHINKNKMPSKF
jgi:hypothetical protein